MKKIIGILAIGMAVLAFNQAIAQDTGKVSGIGMLGYFMPADSTVDDRCGGGVAFGGGVRYAYSPQISIVGALEYWKGDGETTIPGVGTGTGSLSTKADYSLTIMPITVSVIYNIPVQNSAFAPYVGGGLGNYSAKSETGSKSESKSAIGFHILGGCAYPVSPVVDIIATAKYASAKISDWNDMKVGGLTITGGVVYSF